ncbi:outer membrane protein assembly factor BamB family protein [Tsukamurella soli]|uniref:PQQ-binding-like beta-propeller repeat protein n=1 Tax=Tsukamurella soli TaxID=644556 RepID=A0ABP8J5R7_9ACTN
MVARRWSRTRAAGAAAAVVLSTLGAAACSPDTNWVESSDSAAWPGMGGNARNSSYADRPAASTLVAAWTRPTGGPNYAPASITNRGYVALTAKTPDGCSTFYLELTVGRKIYCRRDADGTEMQTPLVDQFDYTYVGIPGLVTSPDQANQMRWRRPVAGDPLWLKFAGPGRLLVITHIGQVLVLDAHSGNPTGPSYGLVPNLTVADPSDGIADCPTAGPGCPVAAPPAVDDGAQRAYVVVKPPGAAHGNLVAFGYGVVNGFNTIQPLWQRTDMTDDPWGSPVLSADGKTLYVNGRDDKLIAVDAQTGRTKWTYDTGYSTKLAPSVAPDGTIVLAAGADSRAPLTALRDEGTSARVLFTRKDVMEVSVPAQVRGGLGYTVVRAWGGGKTQLIEFDTSTGGTRRSFDLPPDVTSTSGVSIGPGGEVVTIADDGVVYAFTSGRKTGDSERSD